MLMRTSLGQATNKFSRVTETTFHFILICESARTHSLWQPVSTKVATKGTADLF